MTERGGAVDGEGTLEAMSQAVQVQKPTAVPAAIFRRPNWLPLALVLGDALIAGVSVILAYEYRYHLNLIPQGLKQPVSFGSFMAAQPSCAPLFLFSPSVTPLSHH